MKANVIKIGNSRGIRIPRAILQQCHIQDEIEIEIKGNNIVIKPVEKKMREGWNEAFKQMKKNKDDRLIIDDSIDLEMEHWKW